MVGEFGNFISDYKLEEKIGEGGFGEVFSAICKKTRQKVAIKKITIQSSQQQSFEKEIRIQYGLKDHPSILRLYKHFFDNGHVYLVLELCERGDLSQIAKDRIKAGDPLSEDEVRNYARQIVNGIHFFHDNCIIHRDLKLSNILVNKDNFIKIADFGLSTRLKEKNDVCKTVCGSLPYMSPQAVGRKSYSSKTDIWSFGVILYILLSRQMPFEAEYPQDIVQKIGKQDYKPIPDWVSSEGRDLISKCLLKEESKRINLKDVAHHDFFQAYSANNGKSNSSLDSGILTSSSSSYGHRRSRSRHHLPLQQANFDDRQMEDMMQAMHDRPGFRNISYPKNPQIRRDGFNVLPVKMISPPINLGNQLPQRSEPYLPHANSKLQCQSVPERLGNYDRDKISGRFAHVSAERPYEKDIYRRNYEDKLRHKSHEDAYSGRHRSNSPQRSRGWRERSPEGKSQGSSGCNRRNFSRSRQLSPSPTAYRSSDDTSRGLAGKRQDSRQTTDDLEPWLSTSGLSKYREVKSNTYFFILDNLDAVSMKLKNKVVAVFRVSPNGKIRAYEADYRDGYKKDPPTFDQHNGVRRTYKYETLPLKHWKFYNELCSFVDLMRFRSCRLQLFFNDGVADCKMTKHSEFRIHFKSGGQCFSFAKGSVKINWQADKYTRVRKLPEDEVGVSGDLPKEIKDLYKEAVKKKKKLQMFSGMLKEDDGSSLGGPTGSSCAADKENRPPCRSFHSTPVQSLLGQDENETRFRDPQTSWPRSVQCRKSQGASPPLREVSSNGNARNIPPPRHRGKRATHYEHRDKESLRVPFEDDTYFIALSSKEIFYVDLDGRKTKVDENFPSTRDKQRKLQMLVEFTSQAKRNPPR